MSPLFDFKAIVHRDIRIPNMFKTGEGKILLNDWCPVEYIWTEKESFGSSTDADGSGTYAVIEGSPTVLNSVINRKFPPQTARITGTHNYQKSIFPSDRSLTRH